jgi:transketolase C-terminal domain/subunit
MLSHEQRFGPVHSLRIFSVLYPACAPLLDRRLVRVVGLQNERACSRVLMDSLRTEFADRIYDPPTSEAAIVSLGAGAAMAGARP